MAKGDSRAPLRGNTSSLQMLQLLPQDFLPILVTTARSLRIWLYLNVPFSTDLSPISFSSTFIRVKITPPVPPYLLPRRFNWVECGGGSDSSSAIVPESSSATGVGDGNSGTLFFVSSSASGGFGAQFVFSPSTWPSTSAIPPLSSLLRRKYIQNKITASVRATTGPSTAPAIQAREAAMTSGSGLGVGVGVGVGEHVGTHASLSSDVPVRGAPINVGQQVSYQRVGIYSTLFKCLPTRVVAGALYSSVFGPNGIETSA